jgi:two-component system chemotaxis response regulator CheY
MPKKETKRSILFVEDEDNIRKVLANKLRREGYDVLEANNGDVAVREFKKKKFDIVLLDIIMPVMNGLEALKAIRDIKKDVKAFIMTNLSDKGKLAEALQLGDYHFLIKANHSLDEIVDRISMELSR